MKIPAICATLCLFLLASCAKQDTPLASAPQATVFLRDGTQVTGAVLSSSPSEIKVAGADGGTRSIPMTQVRSVDYGEPAPAAQVPVPTPASTSGAPASTASRPVVRTPPPEPPHYEHVRPAETAITSKTLALPVGSEVSVRTEETIDSSKATEGQTFAADVARDVLDENGDVVIPRGANAKIIIRAATKNGKIQGSSDLVLDLESVAIGGRAYQISTADMLQKGREGLGANKRTGEFAGGGAALGAIIGAIAGGGKGAAIGALSGGGAGAATQVLTRGSIKVPPETVLTFKLDRPLRIVARL